MTLKLYYTPGACSLSPHIAEPRSVVGGPYLRRRHRGVYGAHQTQRRLTGENETSTSSSAAECRTGFLEAEFGLGPANRFDPPCGLDCPSQPKPAPDRSPFGNRRYCDYSPGAGSRRCGKIGKHSSSAPRDSLSADSNTTRKYARQTGIIQSFAGACVSRHSSFTCSRTKPCPRRESDRTENRSAD